MKRILPFLAVLALCAACKTETQPAAKQPDLLNSGTPKEETLTSVDTAAGTTPDLSVPATNMEPVAEAKADPTAPLQGLWEVNFAMTMEDDPKTSGKKVQGKWIYLKPEGIFTSGVYEKQTNNGTWKYDPDNDIIALNYEKPGDKSTTWKVQLGRDIIIWLGQTAENKSGSQIRLKRTPNNQLPVRK
jgi:hypothetical protein